MTPKSFLKVIEILEETYKEPITIVETGCIRNVTEESKFGDGWSTLNWEYYCKKTNSKVYVVDIPKYVTIEYELMLWCDFTTQLNELVDQILPYGRFAWGNDQRPGGPPTYQEKERMLQEIIPRVPRLILNKNSDHETFYHNLMYKHPETVPVDTKTQICSR